MACSKNLREWNLRMQSWPMVNEDSATIIETLQEIAKHIDNCG